MDIVIDFSQMSMDNPLQTAWFIFINGGWIIFVIVFIWAMIQFWLTYQRLRYYRRWEWVLLSIDIPKVNEQYPKAVEHIFAAIAGTWKKVDWIERFFTGKVQVEFSFELVSRAGYLEFLIRTPRHYRDLVEAAVYAQYPDAEISEVPDYSERFQELRWPNNDQGYDIWGAEFKLLKKYFYPLKTWPQFFDASEAKKGFKDPVYAILENMSKLRKGEEFWFQIVVSPSSNKWKERGHAFVRGLMGQSAAGSSISSAVSAGFLRIFDEIIYAFVNRPEIEVKEEEKKITTKEQEIVEAIQNKLSKIGFRTRMRAVYIARKEIFNKSKVKEGFLGALNQYTDLYANGLVQDKYTKVSPSHLYYFRQYRVNHFRKNKILYNYRIRNMQTGSKFGYGFILNSEELASLWHFPLGNVKTLMIKKTEFVKAEAPFALPMEEAREEIISSEKDGTVVQEVEPEEVKIEEEAGPPDNLPVG